jgi:hypothetical protein
VAQTTLIRDDRDLDGMRMLVLSSSVDLASDRLSEIGADSHLPKPFPIDDLNSTVCELLGG